MPATHTHPFSSDAIFPFSNDSPPSLAHEHKGALLSLTPQGDGYSPYINHWTETHRKHRSCGGQWLKAPTIPNGGPGPHQKLANAKSRMIQIMAVNSLNNRHSL
jgi:hypothetical protein